MEEQKGKVCEHFPNSKMKLLELQLFPQRGLKQSAGRLWVVIIHHQGKKASHLLPHLILGESKPIKEDSLEIEAAYLDSSVPQEQIVFLSHALDKGYLYRLDWKQ